MMRSTPHVELWPLLRPEVPPWLVRPLFFCFCFCYLLLANPTETRHLFRLIYRYFPSSQSIVIQQRKRIPFMSVPFAQVICYAAHQIIRKAILEIYTHQQLMAFSLADSIQIMPSFLTDPTSPTLPSASNNWMRQRVGATLMESQP